MEKKLKKIALQINEIAHVSSNKRFADAEVRNFMQALYQTVGNKRYLTLIEKLIERAEITPDEKQALRFLAQDIRSLASPSKAPPFSQGFFP
jgi:hypothetical protein